MGYLSVSRRAFLKGTVRLGLHTFTLLKYGHLSKIPLKFQKDLQISRPNKAKSDDYF